MILTIIQSYLNYFLKSKKRHGIHSPFVYEFMDKCLSTKIDKKDLKTIQSFAQALKNDREILSITDFGAGSKKMGSERKVSQIFKNSTSGSKYGAFLYKISNYYKPKNILELGTSLGVGTLHLHLGNKDAKIDSVEGCLSTYSFAKNNFKKYSKSENVHFYNSKFEDFLTQVKGEYDLIFIDGDHQKSSLFKLLKQLKNHIHDNTFLILDDIRWSKDMLDAWIELSQQEEFHVSMEFLRMGILLRRESQQKEHFYLRL